MITAKELYEYAKSMNLEDIPLQFLENGCCEVSIENVYVKVDMKEKEKFLLLTKE